MLFRVIRKSDHTSEQWPEGLCMVVNEQGYQDALCQHPETIEVIQEGTYQQCAEILDVMVQDVPMTMVNALIEIQAEP